MAPLRSLPLLGLAALTLAGCGRDMLTLGSSTPAQLRIEPAQLDLYRGQEFRFDVVYSTSTVTRSVLGEGGLELTISPESLATVSNTGEGRVLDTGEGTLVAGFADLEGRASITVRDATLVGIRVEPVSLVLAVDAAQPLTVTGALSDGSSVDLTAPASGTTYATLQENVARVGAGGIVQGVAPGATVIQVRHQAFSANVPVEVSDNPDTLVALRFEPRAFELEPFEGREYQLIGTSANGQDIDVFDAGFPVELFTADPNLVLLSEGFLESTGTPGRTIVQARVGNLTASAEVEIEGQTRELVGLSIEPEFLTMQPGEVNQLQVIGFYSDGSAEDLTRASSGTTYFADAPFIAQPGANGEVFAQSPGGTVIVARNQGFEALVFVEVIGERELVGIDVQPPELRLAVNEQAQLTVIAFFSDGSAEDVTRMAAYIPPISGIVNVSASGRVTGRAAGDDFIFVDYQGFGFPVRVLVTDTTNPVVDVRITPRTIRVDEGDAFFGVDVIASFADGSQASVLFDPGLVINVDDPGIAFWDGIAVVGLNSGRTVLRATFGGVTGTATVIVDGATSVLVRIELSAPREVLLGQTSPISVSAFFSDGSIVDVTTDPQLILQVDDPMIVQAGVGTVTGLSPGQTILRAFYQGQQDSASIRVVDNGDPIVSIEWQPASLTIDVNQTGRARVIATRVSGMQQNISADPALNIATQGPINASSGGNNILVNGVSAGNGEVLATYQGLSARLPVTVQSTMPTLDSIQLVAPAQMVVNQSEFYIVFAVFTDGSIIDITGDPGLTLTASPPLVNFGANFINALQPGTTTVTASYQGETSSQTITITNTNERVVRIFFTPSSMSLSVGQQDTFTLTAEFSSGATADITFDPNVGYNFTGQITPFPGPGGTIGVRGDAVGPATVDATYRGQSAILPITVTQMGPTVVRLLLIAPANIDLGTTATYQVIADFSDGSSVDVTNDPALMVFVQDPSIFSAAGGIITPIQVGSTGLGVTYQGFSAQRSINVVNNNPITSIRFQPPTLNMNVGDTTTVQVIARRDNGATENITAQVNFTVMGPVTLGPGGSDLPILAFSSGTATVQAEFNGLTANLTITIAGMVAPTITALTPDAVLVGTGQIQLTIDGTMFQPGDTVVIDGVPVPSIFVSGTQLRARVAGSFFTDIAELEVQVIGAAGPSNTVTLPVGGPPNVSSYAPDSVVAGSVIDVVAIGTGLTSLTPSIPGLSATVVSEAADGELARIRVSAGANVMPGMYTLTLTNPWGSDAVTITVVPSSGQMDLVVASGQTVRMSGTNVFDNIIVNTGGRIIGTGSAPLALIATGDITLRGTIDVSGDDGEDGFTTPADGGDAGPGGGGGGGGGDGDTNNPADGGEGAPAGEGAGNASGAGTRAGDGGGDGAGEGGVGGCGQGGGGGALGGDGGDGGGDLGDGTGGDGGQTASGSQFGAGTGGGGGSTCGVNSGGGGGGGGGALILQVALGGTISIEGRITADGGDGGFGFSGTGGGGGGSGGLVEVTAPGGTITLIDTISARGGAGGDADFGDGGGGGGGGIIILDASPGGTVDTSLGLFDVTGGTQGIPLGTGFAGRAGSPGATTSTP